MAEAIGIRIDDTFLSIIDKLSRDESLDRSTMLRKLLNLGYSGFMKQKAKDKYLAGQITISQAAKLSNLTIWEMQRYLVEEGYKSEYSIKELEEDMKLLK